MNLDRDIESDEAVKAPEQLGLVLAKIEHLRALGAKRPGPSAGIPEFSQNRGEPVV